MDSSIRADGSVNIFWTGGYFTDATDTVQWNGKPASSTSHFTWRGGYPDGTDGNLRLRVESSATSSLNGMYPYDDYERNVICQYDPNPAPAEPSCDPTAPLVTCAAGEYASTELCYFVSDTEVYEGEMLTTCQSKHATAIPAEITHSSLQTCLSTAIRDDDSVTKLGSGYIYVRTGGVYTHTGQTVQWNGNAASSTSHFSWRDGYPSSDGPVRLRVKSDPADIDNGMYTFGTDAPSKVLCQYAPSG